MLLNKNHQSNLKTLCSYEEHSLNYKQREYFEKSAAILFSSFWFPFTQSWVIREVRGKTKKLLIISIPFTCWKTQNSCVLQRGSMYQAAFQSGFLMNYKCSRFPDYAADNMDTKGSKMAIFCQNNCYFPTIMLVFSTFSWQLSKIYEVLFN